MIWMEKYTRGRGEVGRIVEEAQIKLGFKALNKFKCFVANVEDKGNKLKGLF